MGILVNSQELSVYRHYAEESHLLGGDYMTYYCIDRTAQDENYDPLYNEPTREKNYAYRRFQLWGAWNNNAVSETMGENGLEVTKTRTVYFSYLQLQKVGLLNYIKPGESNVGDIIKCGDGYFMANSVTTQGFFGEDDNPIQFSFETKRTYKFVPERIIENDIKVRTEDVHQSAENDDMYRKAGYIPTDFIKFEDY